MINPMTVPTSPSFNNKSTTNHPVSNLAVKSFSKLFLTSFDSLLLEFKAIIDVIYFAIMMSSS